LACVPGQVFRDAARRELLFGVNAVVFVADSSPDRLDANVEALEASAKTSRRTARAREQDSRRRPTADEKKRDGRSLGSGHWQ
jgi:hypothetical protein